MQMERMGANGRYQLPGVFFIIKSMNGNQGFGCIHQFQLFIHSQLFPLIPFISVIYTQMLLIRCPPCCATCQFLALFPHLCFESSQRFSVCTPSTTPKQLQIAPVAMCERLSAELHLLIILINLLFFLATLTICFLHHNLWSIARLKYFTE